MNSRLQGQVTPNSDPLKHLFRQAVFSFANKNKNQMERKLYSNDKIEVENVF